MNLLELKRDLVSRLLDIGISVDFWEIERSRFADLSFKSFKYKDKIQKIASEFGANPLVRDVKIVGGYVNLFLDREKFTYQFLLESKKPEFGRFPRNGKKIILEHTSVNPTGPIHVGRFRNPVIGDSLRRIFDFLGYEVETQYYVNDVGRQIAIIALGRELGIEPDREVASRFLDYSDKPDFQTFFVYVPAYARSEQDPEFKREVDRIIRLAENGNEEWLEKLKMVASFCLEGQFETLKRCGFVYDKIVFESQFLQDGSVWEILEKLKKTGRLKKTENGALAIDLKDLGSPRGATILLRPDGTSVYLLRDIAYHTRKLEEGDLVINVLGEDHKVEFQELKAILGLLGYDIGKLQVVHFSFVNLPGKRMSTRRGETIPLDQVLDQGKEKALRTIQEKNPALEGKLEVAEKVSLGAIKYALIKQDPMKMITFDWGAALDFEGDTGPYLQYSYARARGILRKARISGEMPEIQEVDDSEWNLVLEMARFPEVVLLAGEERKPNILANYSYSLAKQFNEFYHKERVLGSEKEWFRLSLVHSFSRILGKSLYLLGIDTMERM